MVAPIEKDTSLSTTLIRGLQILGCFKAGEVKLTNAQIADRIGINKATVSRLCKTLIDQNYLRRDLKGGFRLSETILALSYPVLSSMKWREEALEIMTDFANLSKGVTSLAIFSGADAIYIQTAGKLSNFPTSPEIGMTMPIVETLTGRALLSMLSEQEFEAKREEIEKTYPGIFDQQSTCINQAIETCNTKGYCVAFEEWHPNIFAISSPIARTADGLDVCISCGIPSYRARKEDIIDDLAPRLAMVANELRNISVFKD
ncbi:MAG: IclR family transcriptional regulator [Kordiimonadaceae bacterium]|jgi:DNA-binding IclR family transcriptional regulator|nr:IclR family transcriptional regulator [Kordiimonadaceae bacterium]MBT6032871.1 IclR family transcriptional regulator [Kordiimonadaceae bacterium]